MSLRRSQYCLALPRFEPPGTLIGTLPDAHRCKLTESFKVQVQSAWGILSSPELRAKYDSGGMEALEGNALNENGIQVRHAGCITREGFFDFGLSPTGQSLTASRSSAAVV